MVIPLCRWLLTVIFPLLQGEIAGTDANAHPFYVSVVEINYNAKEKQLEIGCKVFTNDLESTLEKFINGKLDLASQNDKSRADKAISDYVATHLQLKLDNKPVSLQYVGSENEAEATWSYFQVEQVNGVKKLEIMDNMLYESYDAQIHIFHITVNGIRKSSKLTNPESRISFDF
jgi:uncharacterized protein DUF6702